MRLITIPMLAAFIALIAAPIDAVGEDKPTPTEKSTDTTKDMSKDKSKSAGTKNGAKAADKLAATDLKVLAQRRHVDQMEIDLGKLAEQKASSPEVKKFAATVVAEHTQVDKNAMALAKKRGATIPKHVAETDAEKLAMKEHKEKMSKLKALKGADFDTAFLAQVIQDHEAEIARIDTALTQTTDPELKELLTTARPILQKHADQARQLQKSAPSS